MTIRVFPSDRLALIMPTSGLPVLSAEGLQVEIYSDQACTTPAPITDTSDVAIEDSMLTVSGGNLPLFKAEADVVYARRAGGVTVTTLYPHPDERIDALEAGFAGLGDTITATVQPQLDTVKESISDQLAPQVSALMQQNSSQADLIVTLTDRMTALEDQLTASRSDTVNPNRVVYVDTVTGEHYTGGVTNAAMVPLRLPEPPAAPTTVTVTPQANRTLIVGFTPDYGGYPADQCSFTATITPETGDPTVVTAAGHPITSPVLPPGTYTVVVTGTNPKGTSPASKPVPAVTLTDALFADTFDYPDGPLGTQGGWLAPYSGSVAPAVQGGKLVLNGAAVLTHSVPDRVNTLTVALPAMGSDVNLYPYLEILPVYALRPGVGYDGADVTMYLYGGTVTMRAFSASQGAVVQTFPIDTHLFAQDRVLSAHIDWVSGEFVATLADTHGVTAWTASVTIPASALAAISDVRQIGLSNNSQNFIIDSVRAE